MWFQYSKQILTLAAISKGRSQKIPLHLPKINAVFGIPVLENADAIKAAFIFSTDAQQFQFSTTGALMTSMVDKKLGRYRG